MRIWVQAAGIIGPGMSGWESTRAMLAGNAPYPGGELRLPPLDLLPAVERRRTGMLVKLVLAAGQDALGGSRESAAGLSTVFASSGGDGDVINDICATLASDDRQVSPTRFHNSVHNAPAGYWSIATGSHAPSTSLSAYDCSFAAGLVEAAAQIASGRDRLLLFAADMPYPEPLLQVRPVTLPFACALLLASSAGAHCLGMIDVDLCADREEASRMGDANLEHLRLDNPSARPLPLLGLLAQSRAGTVVLDYVGGKSLRIEVAPC